MSKIISELVGKNCKIKTEEGLLFAGNTEVKGTVLDVDDEWIKFTYSEQKNVIRTKILRIDSIDNVELITE